MASAGTAEGLGGGGASAPPNNFGKKFYSIEKLLFYYFHGYAIINDEHTDINNQGQLTICLRWVDDTLEAHEDFLGFYLIPNIASDTVVSVIKDAFIRLQLSLQSCRGQCYDGASNMLGKRSGVVKQIQDIQKKAHPTPCSFAKFKCKRRNESLQNIVRHSKEHK